MGTDPGICPFRDRPLISIPCRPIFHVTPRKQWHTMTHLTVSSVGTKKGLLHMYRTRLLCPLLEAPCQPSHPPWSLASLPPDRNPFSLTPATFYLLLFSYKHRLLTYQTHTYRCAINVPGSLFVYVNKTLKGMGGWLKMPQVIENARILLVVPHYSLRKEKSLIP